MKNILLIISLIFASTFTACSSKAKTENKETVTEEIVVVDSVDASDSTIVKIE